MIGTTEIILIVLVVLLLFGGKKIPELMRGLGSGVKSFRTACARVTSLRKRKMNRKKTEIFLLFEK